MPERALSKVTVFVRLSMTPQVVTFIPRCELKVARYASLLSQAVSAGSVTLYTSIYCDVTSCMQGSESSVGTGSPLRRRK